jgi:hypothetical protein
VPEREKADLLHAGNLLIFRLVCDLKGGSWRKSGRPAGNRRRADRGQGRCRDKRSIVAPVSSSPALFFARLSGPGVESGYRSIRLPKLHIVVVDEPPGGFDGGLIINTIQLNHANGSVV